MKKIFTLLFICSNFSITLFAQNVGISNSGAVPAASAMLDIVASDKGLLVPRLALSDITVAAPVTAPALSLVVYNTFTSALATASNNVVPGFYYWDGTKWVAFSGSGGREWALLGNAGTVAGTNFLGTTDNIDLVFKVNNIQAGRLTSNTNNNAFFGFESGLNNTSTFNAFYGSQAGKANTTGGNNVGIGFGAMRNSTTGGVNTFVGNNAGANWVTSLANTAIGNQALQGLAASTGSCNTAIGFAAGSGYTGTPPSGSANGLSQLSGSYNTYIGYSSSSTTSSNTFTNSTAIGAFSQAGANNVLILGGINGANGATATTSVGIGLTVPTTLLDAFSGAGDAVFGHSSNVGGYLGRETNITFGTPVQTLLGAGLYAANPSSGYTSSYAQSTGLADVAASINFSSVWMASYNYVENAAASAFNPSASYNQLNNSSTTLTGAQSAIRGFSTKGTAAGNTGITVGGNFTAVAQNQVAIGVYGTALTNQNRAGGYFESYDYAGTGGSQTFAYVGANLGVQRKITGNGTVNEIVPTSNHGRVTLTCPESPEYWYQDYGTVELVNGKAHVDLDPILVDIIVVNEENPIRVFCTPVDMLYYNGVAIVNKTATGFDVVEINGGTHTGKIDYQIVVKPKTNYGEGRFSQAPGPAWVKSDKEPASAKAKNQIDPSKIFTWPADWEVYGYDVEKMIGIGDMVPAGPNKGKFKVAEGVFMDQMPAQQPKK